MRAFAVLVFGFGALALTACGFRPLYGTGPGGMTAEHMFAAVELDEIGGRLGPVVYHELQDQLHPAGRAADVATRYRLAVKLKEKREGRAIEPDASITRFDYRLSGHYRLIEIDGNKVVHTGAVSSSTAYNVVESQFATLSAREDAELRAARGVSEEIRLRLAIFLRGVADG